ncbi:hypothetical protein [Profundibacter amoris]|uniref:Uncharacterized protein n=1 Tax=Profundibacter amoris TaxID=2171755 RepID=A0A347UCU8_9RHOB|nr:hypothetical protein [Profundibacter amoris]AXX96676.1 hypothetical protein BAR1_01210 [Profundibacter amoris]
MFKPLFALTLCNILPGAAMAATYDDPDWPCIQRKVPEISVAQMWAGPEVTDAILAMGKEPKVATLAAQLALRRVPMDQAEQMIADFAADLGKDRNDMLTALFAKTFAHIASERKSVMAGISRYAHKQTGLSARIEEKRTALVALKSKTPPDYDRQEELQDNLVWEERIFRERAQSLTYVCETPVLLEQRIFAIARAIQSHLAP